MGGSRRVHWALAVGGLFFGACSSTGLSVGRSAGVSAAGVTFVEAGSCSMFPAFGPGDRLQLNSTFGEPQRGDIVLYRATFAAGEPQEMVHRVVGLPGERLDPAPDGRLLVDGAPLVEDYLPPRTTTYMRGPVEVPPDRWFMLGDNRERSSDSRVTGSILRADILAKLTNVDPIKRAEEDDC